MVRDELTKDERFKAIEMESDVAGLMEILREMVHSNAQTWDELNPIGHWFKSSSKLSPSISRRTTP
jgi:hypothetical protein